MSLPKDLLDQAGHLVRREPKRPKQASLRRAISASYYALFNLLIDDASRFLVSGNAGHRQELRQSIRRAFAHGDMKKVSNAFKGGTPPQEWMAAVGGPVPHDLKLVAEAFFELQEARHEADYDMRRTYSRREAEELVRRCDEAFRAWSRCRKTPAAEAYMTALLVHKQLRG